MGRAVTAHTRCQAQPDVRRGRQSAGPSRKRLVQSRSSCCLTRGSDCSTGAGMTSHKAALAALSSIQSSDSSVGAVTDSPDSERRPLDAPKAVNGDESSSSYGNVVATLNRKWRVIRCRDGIQWILQSRDSLTATVGIWRGRSYCRTKEALLRVSQLTPTRSIQRPPPFSPRCRQAKQIRSHPMNKPAWPRCRQ
jgi:hypothetical protein